MPWPLDRQRLLDIHGTMVRIRLFEEKSIEVSRRGLTPGRMHPYSGEEAVAAGVCAALLPQDRVLSTHRGAGHLIARGGDARSMFAEFMGRSTGYGQGKGGPMHLSAPELGFLATTGIVGSGITIAAGVALAMQMQKSENVAVSFFGDGASNTGSFHEGLNIAAVWKLPVVYVCENNLYGETMPISRAIASESIACRAAAYGMPGVGVDGMDPGAVYEAAEAATSRARRGEGPTLIEAHTYRYGGHFDGESQHYRRHGEMEEWQQKDPIPRYERWLVQEGYANEDELRAERDKIAAQINSAATQAEGDPLPAPEGLRAQVSLPLAVEARP